MRDLGLASGDRGHRRCSEDCEGSMIDTPSIDETINLLMRAHEGQFDKAGEPYWRHPIRVMARLVLRTPEISLEAMQAALLHDASKTRSSTN
jgi:(p)ppGpp synthase/HD superfamily hydrolase